MASDTTALSSAITVQPGEESRVFRGDGSGPAHVMSCRIIQVRRGEPAT